MITLRRELRLTFTDNPTGDDLSIKNLFEILDLCRHYHNMYPPDPDGDETPIMDNVFQLLGHIEAVLSRPITKSLYNPDDCRSEDFPL